MNLTTRTSLLHLYVICIIVIINYSPVTCKFNFPFALLRQSSSAVPSVARHASLLPNPFKFIHRSSTSRPADDPFDRHSHSLAQFPFAHYDFEKEGDWTWNNASLLDTDFSDVIKSQQSGARESNHDTRLSDRPSGTGDTSQELRKRKGNGLIKPYLYEVSNPDKSEEELLRQIPALAIAHSGYMSQVGKFDHRTDDAGHDSCAHCPAKVKVVKVKVKSKPKVIYKFKKIYIPKKIIKKVPVIKKVPKYIIKEKIKIVPVVKKVPVIKKIKVPVPYKVKYIKVKKIKVPVIKKIKIPVIRKVVKYKTKKIKHVHVHKISLKKKKKKKKMGMFKKMKMKMLKKKMKKMMPDCYEYRSSCGCNVCPCPVLPMIPTLPPIPMLPPVPMLPFVGRRRRSAVSESITPPKATDLSNVTVVQIGETASYSHGVPVIIPGVNLTGDGDKPLFLKRSGLLYNPLGRLSDECNDFLSSHPIERADDDEESDETQDDDAEDEEEMAMRRRKRSLHRQLLLGPRVTWFDSSGWSFSHPTVSFFHPP